MSLTVKSRKELQMSLTVKSSGADFETTPEGTYLARCYRLLDLGTQTTTSQFGTKEQHKVMITWELLDDDVKMTDGRPYAITQWYTASLHEKAQLRKDLEAWRGKKFTGEELEGFDLKTVVGSYCMIQVVHSTDGKYANVQAIMKAPKGDKPAAVNPNAVFDIDKPDMAIFEGLSDNLKGRIMSAPEWQAKGQQTAPVKAAGAKSVSKPAEPLDEVIEDIPEEINLEDIPF